MLQIIRACRSVTKLVEVSGLVPVPLYPVLNPLFSIETTRLKAVWESANRLAYVGI